MTYTLKGGFPEYIPTVIDQFEETIVFEGEEISYSLWDQAGGESYSRLRTLSYPETDIFFVIQLYLGALLKN